MITVYKYQLQITDLQEIMMPVDAQMLHVGLGPDKRPCLWAKVDNLKISRAVKIAVTGTGHEVPGGVVHVGSFVDGSFVWHVWRVEG